MDLSDDRTASRPLADCLALARLCVDRGDERTCAIAGAEVVLFGLRWLGSHEALVEAAQSVESWLKGGTPLGDAVSRYRRWHLHWDGDWATRAALGWMGDALEEVGQATELVTLCEDVIEVARFRDWDELLAEATFCEAAGWPPSPEYEAMEKRREEAVAEVSQAIACILRARLDIAGS